MKQTVVDITFRGLTLGFPTSRCRVAYEYIPSVVGGGGGGGAYTYIPQCRETSISGFLMTHINILITSLTALKPDTVIKINYFINYRLYTILCGSTTTMQLNYFAFTDWQLCPTEYLISDKQLRLLLIKQTERQLFY